jgi:ribosomal protein S18 acetylase RimI-like enzyme
MNVALSRAPERVPPSDWPRLGPFIFRHNRLDDGRVRCLHGDQGDTEAAHVHELAGLQHDAAAFWRVPDEDGQPLGVIGCELDVALARAWIRGPWTEPGDRASPMAGALLRALEAALPEIERFDAFPNLDDAALNALYGAAGYRRMAVHRVMQAVLGAAPPASLPAPSGSTRIARAAPADLPLWLPLHHALFPGSYMTDSELDSALRDEQRLVLTAWVQNRPAGYLVANDEAAMDEIYVDFIGVDPASRGQGVGRALLLEALHWGRALGRRHAALTVREDRDGALSLYRQCGFSQVSAGVHWRRGEA